MNFGNWIVVAFVLFAIFIGVLVTVCVRQDISLVSKNYYGEELAYQDQIKRINNTTGLNIKPGITKIGNNTIQVTFDKAFKIENGKVKFFCPSDPKMDKDFELTANSNTQLFNTSALRKGMYKVKLLWVMDGKEFYFEEIINI
jgi:hypothetical protein